MQLSWLIPHTCVKFRKQDIQVGVCQVGHTQRLHTLFIYPKHTLFIYSKHSGVARAFLLPTRISEVWGKIRKIDLDLRKTEESGTLAQPGLWGWLWPCPSILYLHTPSILYFYTLSIIWFNEYIGFLIITGVQSPAMPDEDDTSPMPLNENDTNEGEW